MNVTEYNKAVDAYADGLYRFLLKSSNDAALAQDGVQECFVKLWQHRDRVNEQKVKSWLFSTAHHWMIDWWRKEKRMESHATPEMGGFAQNQYSDVGEILEQALLRLPETQRQLVLLRDYEGYSYQEIGELTGLSESQVKVYIFRARKALKQYIGSLHTVL